MLREHLEGLEVKVIPLDAAKLTDKYEGEPIQRIQKVYHEAEELIAKGIRAVIVIQDIDKILEENGDTEHSGNHNAVVQEFMRITDGTVRENATHPELHVPFIATGNYGDSLYEPLRRSGRFRFFEWEPSKDERIDIIQSIFNFSERWKARLVEKRYSGKDIAFFSDMVEHHSSEMLSCYGCNGCLKEMLENDDFRREILERYTNAVSRADWLKIMGIKPKIIKLKRKDVDDVCTCTTDDHEQDQAGNH